MPKPQRVDIRSKKRLLDAFFKIDEYEVSYERYGGEMSKYYPRLNFERGDAVGVLLFNRDTQSVVLVEQFKLPTLIGRRRDNPGTPDGWIEEVMAGMIPPNETPDETARRETLEETGYEIEDLELICKFLSSPGGTSERIFLYYAAVTDARRPGKDQIGAGDENIKVFERSVNDLFDDLEKGKIEDPKLAIAAYWLKDNMPRIEELDPGTLEYEVVGKPGLIIGYKTGDVETVKGIDVWVNAEPSDMMMDRFIGRSVSARIRSMGANKQDGSIVEDTIQESLRGLMGERTNVDIGTVFITEAGMLRKTHGVQRIFHVAGINCILGQGIKADKKDLAKCVKHVLDELEQENNRIWRKICNNNLETVLFPMMGAGEGGLPIKTVAEEIIPPAIHHFKSVPNPAIKKIYFLGFRLRERNACDKVLDEYRARGVLKRVPPADEANNSRLEAVGGQKV
jgi:nudix-type nucleoside diphosphatase (YffH/AdpP family)